MKTTKSDFRAFKRAFLAHVEAFGLQDYGLTFYHRELDEGVDARLNHSAQGRTAAVSLATEINIEAGARGELMSKRDAILDCAKHEAIHLLLGELTMLARDRFVRSDSILMAEESVTRRLVRLIR